MIGHMQTFPMAGWHSKALRYVHDQDEGGPTRGRGNVGWAKGDFDYNGISTRISIYISEG